MHACTEDKAMCELWLLVCRCGHILLACGCGEKHETRMLDGCSKCAYTGLAAMVRKVA